MKRSRLLNLIAAGLIDVLDRYASAPQTDPDITAAKQSGPIPKKADLLFVQNARGVSFSKDEMSLRRVNPITIAFADRPGTAEWGNGSGSAYGYRGGSAEWGGASGSATGYRGNSVSWHRR